MVDDILRAARVKPVRPDSNIKFMRWDSQSQIHRQKSRKERKKVNPFTVSREDLSIIRLHKYLKQKVK